MYGILLAFLSASLFGFSNILVRKGFARINPRQGVYITILFSLVTVFIFTAADGEFFQIGSMGYLAFGLFALVGFLNFNVGRLLNYTSINLSGPSTTSALISLRIVFAIIFSVILLHEALTFSRITGDVLMFFGVTAVTLSNGFEKRRISKGVLLAFIASAVLGLSDVIVSVADSLHSMPANGLFISYLMGAVTYLPLISGKNSITLPGDRSAKRLVLVLLGGVGVVSGLAQAARYFSLSMAPVSVAVPIISLTPILTMVFSYFILKTEKLGYLFIAGVLMAFAGSIFLSL